MTLSADGIITYANASCHHIFKLYENTDLTGKSFEHIFLRNKKNKAFQKFYDALMEGTLEREETHLSYYTADGEKISLLIQVSAGNQHSPTPEIMLLVKDRSVHITLRQRDRDCAFIFSGLIICITLYLMIWSCIRFTLNIHLRTAVFGDHHRAEPGLRQTRRGIRARRKARGQRGGTQGSAQRSVRVRKERHWLRDRLRSQSG